MTSAGFNRRMRKTARPVVWKGPEAQSPCPHPILKTGRIFPTDAKGGPRMGARYP
jgi:hypothetical protein